MSGGVTVRYLRRRFWIAKLVLFVMLAASAGVAFVTLKSQESRSEYGIALQHLGNSVSRLEDELDHLVFRSRRGVASRDAARLAFASVDRQFRRIVWASRAGQAPAPAPAGADTIATAAGTDLPRFHLEVGRMPDGLARMWMPGSGARDAGPSANLEYVIDRVLLLANALATGEGPLSAREVDRVQTIKSSIAALITPRLEEITAVLDEDLHASVDRALMSLLALLAVAAFVAMLNVFVIFRPLERAVMSAQARLEVERDRAVEAAAAKRNFLSVVSHELRTPMNGVLGFAELLLASGLEPEQRRQVEIIRSSGKTLLALVNDILDLSRIEAGGLELSDEAFPLEEVVGEVLGLVRAGVTGRDIDTAVYIDPRLPRKLRGDPERVRQILTNLVGNAVKFTERGTVTVEAHRLDSGKAGTPTVELVVRDTGPGIPPDQQARIFERFTQAERAGRHASEGTGLGLAICRELSERMGGDIGVESVPGMGATFRVRLRLTLVEEPGPAPVSDEALAGMRVLIVAANPIIGRLIRRQLEGWGLTAETAAGAKEAWRRLEVARADGRPHRLALIDRTLADGDPDALARQMREDPRFAGVGLLLVTEAGRPDVGGEEGPFHAVEAPPLVPRLLRAALVRVAGALVPGDPAAGAQSGTPRARVLLAEDDTVSRQLVIRLLEAAGYRVEAVEDGASAVEASARGGHDVVLMDIRMPGLDGLGATRRIRALGGAAARLPIVALTANASAEDAAEYRMAGMDGLIAKPIEAGRLLEAVDRALRAAAASSAPDSAGSADRGPAGSPVNSAEPDLVATR